MTLKDFLISQKVNVPKKLPEDIPLAIGYNSGLEELLSIELPEQRKWLRINDIAILLQEQDFLDGDMLEGALIDVISFRKCKKIATAIHEALK